MKINKYVVLAAMLLMAGCSKVEPGYVGIKVNQYGSQKGVQDFPIQTGRVWYNPFTEDIYKFPTFVQNVVWDKDVTKQDPSDNSITFNSIEGAVINADLALAYSFIADKVPHIFIEFRQEPEIITHGWMKNEINNSFNRIASKMKATDIFGEKKQQLLDEVKADLDVKLLTKGMKIELVSFHGALRVEASVQNSINAVLSASQRAIEAENKIKQSQAEAQQAKAKAEGEAFAITAKAQAQADANNLVSKSITPELINWMAIEKWDGKLPQVTSGALPFIGINTNK